MLGGTLLSAFTEVLCVRQGKGLQELHLPAHGAETPAGTKNLPGRDRDDHRFGDGAPA